MRPGLDDLPHPEPVGCLCDACQDWLLATDDQTVAPYRRAALWWLGRAGCGAAHFADAVVEAERMKEHERLVLEGRQLAQRDSRSFGSADPRDLRVDFGAVLEALADRCLVTDDGEGDG